MGEEEDDNDGDENKSPSPSKSARSRGTTGQSFPTRSAAGKSADVDPTAKMIVSEFVPVLASCHSDGFIRFWDLKVSTNKWAIPSEIYTSPVKDLQKSFSLGEC